MFDLLFLNGEPLVKRPFKERRELLKQNFREHAGEWLFATCLDTTKMEEVQEFLDESVKGLPGISPAVWVLNVAPQGIARG